MTVISPNSYGERSPQCRPSVAEHLQRSIFNGLALGSFLRIKCARACLDETTVSSDSSNQTNTSTMKFTSFFSLFALPAIVMASATPERRAVSTSATWSSYYTDASTSLGPVACSNGNNGLTTRFGYTTMGDVPSFPYVAAGPVNLGFGWNSSQCGSCWSLTYTSPNTHVAKTISVTIIDAASTFALSQDAYVALSGSDGLAAGHVDVEATKLGDNPC
ncbi:Cerato-platanin-domain-containing protein [Cyathus striatus]|nr:Cerato-platanin-domain-containing protein [Cyathus striatus]